MDNSIKFNFKNRTQTDDYETFIDKIIDFMTSERRTLAIVDYSDVDEILDVLLEKYSNIEVEDFDSENDEEDNNVYVIAKLENQGKSTNIIIQPLYRDKERCICCDYMICDANVWKDDMVSKVYPEFDGVQFIELDEQLDYEYDDSFDNERDELEDENEETFCSCDHCSECKDCDDEEESDEIEDMVSDYIEQIVESQGCPNCIGDILYEFVNEILGFVGKYTFDDCKLDSHEDSANPVDNAIAAIQHLTDRNKEFEVKVKVSKDVEKLLHKLSGSFY
jgi:hypothetical protein